MWDVFISHASEDKETVARPLAGMLTKAGLKVWFDEFTLSLGDGLRQSIDYGLAKSRYGIVILSPNFFAKVWTKRELDALMARESDSTKIILPVWHNLTRADVVHHSPLLADRLGVSTSEGLKMVVKKILLVARPAKGKGRLKAQRPTKSQNLYSLVVIGRIKEASPPSEIGKAAAQFFTRVERTVMARLHPELRYPRPTSGITTPLIVFRSMHRNEEGRYQLEADIPSGSVPARVLLTSLTRASRRGRFKIHQVQLKGLTYKTP
jgi:hypothetical protein